MKKLKIYILLLTLTLVPVLLAACAGQAVPLYTPIPTLIPATIGPQNVPAARVEKVNPVVAVGPTAAPGQKPAATKPASAAARKCEIAALDLLSTWANAGLPEEDSFDFTDQNGKACEAHFTPDVLNLFTQPNVWYQGSLACVNCHTADVASATANLSMVNYAAMKMGSRRTGPDAKGNDIFGGGNWEQSLLYMQLSTKMMPLGRPADSPDKGLVVKVGKPK